MGAGLDIISEPAFHLRDHQRKYKSVSNDFYLDDIGLFKAQPELLLKVDAGELELRWQVDPTWKLYTSSSMTIGSWNAVTNIPATIAALNILRLPIDAPRAFFRLQRTP